MLAYRENEELNNIIEKYIKKEQYGNYTPILREILQRRAFEFDFSNEKMESEIQNLISNVKKIGFASKEDAETLGEFALGAYFINEKEIRLNPTYYLNLYKALSDDYPPEIVNYFVGEKMFHTLTHETYHGINARDDGTVGVEHINFDMKQGNSLNEIVTESATTRTIREKDIKDLKKGCMGTVGYQPSTCFTNLMANAIGVSEKELLANSMDDYSKFKQFFFEHLPENVSETEKKSILSSLQFKMSLLGKTEWLETNQVFAKQGFEAMYTSFFELAEMSMQNDDRESNMEKIGEMHYRVQKLHSIMYSSIDYLQRENFITQEGMQEIISSQDLQEKSEKLQSIVLDEFLKYKGQDRGNRTNADIEQQLLLEGCKSADFAKGKRKFINDDFISQTNWDNSICQYVARTLAEESKQIQSEDKLFEVNANNVFEFVANRKQIFRNDEKRK